MEVRTSHYSTTVAANSSKLTYKNVHSKQGCCQSNRREWLGWCNIQSWVNLPLGNSPSIYSSLNYLRTEWYSAMTSKAKSPWEMLISGRVAKIVLRSSSAKTTDYILTFPGLDCKIFLKIFTRNCPTLSHALGLTQSKICGIRQR